MGRDRAAYNQQWHIDHKEEVHARKAASYQESKPLRKEKRKLNYQANHVAIDAANTKRRKSLQDFIYQQKVGKPCVRCGIVDPRVLDFHHLDPAKKELNLARAWQRNISKQRMIDEIAKCELVCANCHRILHWEERHGE